MIMKSPPHPGSVVRHACLDALALSVTDAAVILGVSRQALSNVVNGRANVSADMAIRLERAFGSTADTWLRMQMAYDLAQARLRANTMKVRRYRPIAASA
jgi:addiction module HigA family antidote